MEITDNIFDLLARTHTLTKSIADINFGCSRVASGETVDTALAYGLA